MILGENIVLGVPRLRQLRVGHSHCRFPTELPVQSAPCYPIYERSREDRDPMILSEDQQYNYTTPKETDAFELSNVLGPYSTGGFIHFFSTNGTAQDAHWTDLKDHHWINISTRAVFLEFIYYNPNTDLLTSINILFEFLTTGMSMRQRTLCVHRPFPLASRHDRNPGFLLHRSVERLFLRTQENLRCFPSVIDRLLRDFRVLLRE